MKDYNSHRGGGGGTFTSSARTSHSNSSSWCSRGVYFVRAEPPERKRRSGVSRKSASGSGKRLSKNPVVGISRRPPLYELVGGFEFRVLAGKKAAFVKVEPKRSSPVQDVGLRQRGLGGIPVGAVSGTCSVTRS